MPDLNPPPHLPITVSYEEEVSADRADLYVTVRGSSLFTGDMALKKAREVGQLVADLNAIGLGDEHIRLQGVRGETATGMFTKSSTVLYDLKIHCPQLSLLADVIGIVTSQKNTELRNLIWRYPDITEIQERFLDLCIEWANRKSQRIAKALGVELLGVATLKESGNALTPWKEEVLSASPTMNFGRAQERLAKDTFGMELSHTKVVQLQVEVQYLISGFIKEGQENHGP